LEHGKLPDPVAAAIRIVLAEQGALRERLARIEIIGGITVPSDIFSEKIREIVREFNDGEGI
jgi:serine O-acetyltransferase